MEFKEAFALLVDLHDQNGDRSWNNHRDEAQQAVRVYPKYSDWQNNLHSRTDISQDYKWDVECFETSFKVLFALMGKV
jgi:hypothetical protein